MALYGVLLRPVLKAVNFPDYPVFILAGLLVWLFFHIADRRLDLAGRAVGPGLQGPLPAPDGPGRGGCRPTGAVLRDVGGAAAGGDDPAGSTSAAMLELPLVIVCLFALTLGHGADRPRPRLLPRRPADPERSPASLVLRLGHPVPAPDASRLASIRARSLLRWGNPIAPFIEAYGRALLRAGTVGRGTALHSGCRRSGNRRGAHVFHRYEGELAVVL